MKYIYRCNACEKRWSTDSQLLTDEMLEDLDLSSIICLECSIEIITSGASIENFIVVHKE